jgi:predicted transcriptional regulator
MSDTPTSTNALQLTARIIAAHVSNNAVESIALPALIISVFMTLNQVGEGAPAQEPPQPAVPVKKSVFPDYLICLEDGKKLKMLKRYLRNSYNMTPDEYRHRWKLPSDYPMVAPVYTARRSVLAKSIGLGRKRSETAAMVEKPVQKLARGRKKAG